MEKYNAIIEYLVPKLSFRDKILKEVSQVFYDKDTYQDLYFRMANENDDLVWLQMVDSLIGYGFAFEIDWKEYYTIAKTNIEKLLSNYEAENSFIRDENFFDKSAEEFFPLINEKIKVTNCQIFNLIIDSDSYVTVMTNSQSEEMLLALDPRIRKY